MFRKIQKIHFVGIGGVGMSGIAEVLLNRGYSVSGSDVKLSPVTERLVALGATVLEGHRGENLDAADVVVISSAIKPDNSELAEASRRHIPIIPRAEMLAELMRTKYGIAIAGTHGKTTTTSMVATLLQHAEMDPTVVVGGRLNSLGSNAKLGTGEFMVVEADESDRSFLLLSPTMVVVTNIDEDHMENYQGLEDLKEAFLQFINKVPFYGAAVLCKDDPNVGSILPSVKRRVLSYGFSPQADVQIVSASPQGHQTRFALSLRGQGRGEYLLRVPGRHNILNAAAAVAVGMDLEIPSETIRKALENFLGADRRFQIKGQTRGITFVDDYAHHPTEILTTLEGARNLGSRRLYVVFQPHRFSRTRYCFENFSRCFDLADVLILADIYPAGEEPLEGVNSANLVESIRRHGHRNARHVGDLEDISNIVEKELAPGDLLITMGAGNVWKVGEELLKRLR
jgi:UDP-N-acetylmuramate--alanine ligase